MILLLIIMNYRVKKRLKKLSKEFPGTGLLRYHPKAKDFALSWKTSKGMIRHIALKGRSLEEVVHEYKVNQLLLPTGKLVSVSASKNEQVLVEQAEIREPLPIGKYDHQIILNLGKGSTAEQLTAKATKAHLSSETIDPHYSDSDLLNLSQLAPSSRLYIVGHCDKGRSYLTSDGKPQKRMKVKQFVEMLVKQAPQLMKQTSPERRIKISLIACLAGSNGPREKKSFGFQLCQALAEAGIYAEVVARTESVGVAVNDADPGRKRGAHGFKADKLSFISEGGKTIEKRPEMVMVKETYTDPDET
jgi:hypothetical protein